MKIESVPLFERVYDCWECGMLMPYDSNNHCFGCGCDSPVGPLDDDTISHEQWELEQEPIHVIWMNVCEKLNTKNPLHIDLMKLRKRILKENNQFV